ncbi:hypothetical protein GALMADRAFT_258875 [Galerina marginata CBS 339.88]|uniref:Uncharacterized protein n=1 Tax=Galerina marginata (strain CBS 339.88) TaxID=685588 RepID=A0A067SIW6_GALM3|nr:hypothetical protein GALMADRAFT_258875 [Galerina marginata CBS 339.88]
MRLSTPDEVSLQSKFAFGLASEPGRYVGSLHATCGHVLRRLSCGIRCASCIVGLENSADDCEGGRYGGLGWSSSFLMACDRRRCFSGSKGKGCGEDRARKPNKRPTMEARMSGHHGTLFFAVKLEVCLEYRL